MMRKYLFIILIILMKNATGQEDISPNGTASQSSNYRTRYAYLAITGGPSHDFNAGSCSATNSNQNISWWMLTFPSDKVFVSNVIIYYRSNSAGRLAGYYLFVTNNSISSSASSPPDDGHLCYRHTGNTLPEIVQNVTCNQLGKYVIIYNERRNGVNYPKGYSDVALLELCDVQVIGCYKSLWGGGCRKECPSYCIDHHCHPNNGTCIWGCSSNNCLSNECSNGGLCTKGCRKGQAGLLCNKKNVAVDPILVNGNAHNKHVAAVTDGDKTDASCVNLNGSDSRLQIDTGEQRAIAVIILTLPKGLSTTGYSIFVSNTSGTTTKAIDNIDNNLIIHTFPFLVHEIDFSSAIVGRYVVITNTGDTMGICEVEIAGCPTGSYGDSCDLRCPLNCDGPCHPGSGICVYGCKDGYIGSNCSEACTPPNFGKFCKETCHCLNVHCNFVNGTCPSGGCTAGWEGHSCSQGCKQGRFGINCVQTCHGCLLSECNGETGICTNSSGCRPGWEKRYPKCNVECEDGYFGNCSTQCNCRDGICDKSTGFCPGNVCDRGWMGNTCSQECTSGTFGYNCANKCDGCVNETCDRYEGNCTYGCLPGHETHTCQLLVEKSEVTSSPIGAIGGGVGGTAVVLIIAISVVFFMRHRKLDRKAHYRNKSKEKKFSPKEKNRNLKSRKTKKRDTVDDDQYVNIRSVNVGNIQESENKEELDMFYINHGAIGDEKDIYNNTCSHKFSVDELQNVIREKKKDSGYQKDFETLPKGLFHPHKEGSKEENKIKNRFLTTWPYDHSRVVLSGNGTSDYINASFIDSYSKKRNYIATQGPKTNTVQDFWHMVWQENVEIIVMVTKVEEHDRKKCYSYWPNHSTSPQDVGHYELSLLEETETAVYVYRKIRLVNKNEEQGTEIHHFHYLQWEDHDVPDTTKLINFYWKVKRNRTSSEKPMVVHCSAGIGRTGTFIAIDALYENGLKTGFIDVVEFVQMMRKDRMNMIQTQYATVYEALLEAFTVPDSAVDQEEFCSSFDIKNLVTIPKNQRKMSLEFRKLQDIKPCYTEANYRAANLEDNISKNINKLILPNDKFRPYLMSYGKSRTDYINAVIIPSFIPQRNIIVTQFPLKSTVVDFWTLIYDTECSTVVILEALDDIIQILPEEGKSIHFEILEISKEHSSPISTEVKIKHKKNNDYKQVEVLVVNDWPAKSITFPSIKCMLELQALVSNASGSIVVVCRDGCDRSGMFVALNLTMQKMELENVVDLFHVVRLIQVKRPEFLSCPEQYEFCYKCIRQHLEMDSVYANA